MPQDIISLAKAIEANFDCSASHLESIPIHESHQGKTIWRGIVEVFAIKHPSGATRAYGWSYADLEGDLQTAHTTVLGIPPIRSAHDAVKAALCAAAASA